MYLLILLNVTDAEDKMRIESSKEALKGIINFSAIANTITVYGEEIG